MTVLLPQAVGFRRAAEMSLTGSFMTASEALQTRLVNRVVPHADLLTEALRTAAELVGNDARAVRRLVAHYRDIASAHSLDEAFSLERALNASWRHPAATQTTP
jgi:enoyl-CoA hydratase